MSQTILVNDEEYTGSLDLKLSAAHEAWGGLYLGVGYDRGRGAPVFDVGYEAGELVAAQAVAVMLLAGLVVAVAESGWEPPDTGCVFRCSEYGDDGSD